MLSKSFKYLGQVSDFPEYYTAAWLAFNFKGEQIYNLEQFGLQQMILFPELHERIVGFYLTPFMVPLFLPLLVIPVSQGYFVWLFLLVLCLIGFCLITARLLKLKSRSAWLLWAFLSVSGPAYESLRLGQIGPFLLLSYMSSVYAMIENKPVLAGVLLMPMLGKPHLLFPLICFYFGAKKYKELLVLLICGLLLGLSSYALMGSSGFENYLHHLESNFLIKEHFTPTLRDQLRMLLPGFSIPISQISVLVYSVICIYSCCLARLLKDSYSCGLASVLFVMPAALLFSPYVQIYDWILIAPSLAVFFLSGYCDRLQKAQVRVLLVTLFSLLMPFSVFIHYYYLKLGGIINPFFWIGLFFFCLVNQSLWVELRSSKEV